MLTVPLVLVALVVPVAFRLVAFRLVAVVLVYLLPEEEVVMPGPVISSLLPQPTRWR
ncbi:MAG: hypothetical protein V2A65_07205 [Candidatus Omnitrophota bacterium]